MRIGSSKKTAEDVMQKISGYETLTVLPDRQGLDAELPSMKDDRTNIGWFSLVAVALLILASCSRSAALGQRFSLQEGETVSVRGTGLAMEIEQVGNQQPGSQEIMDGFVFLRVIEKDGGQTTVYLEVGGQNAVGGYEIHLERVVLGADIWSCELIVTR
jgi:hypothetical protein